MQTKERATISIDKEVFREFKNHCKSEGKDISKVLCILIKNFLEETNGKKRK